MSSWKENSHVITASISAAAAIAFAIGVYEQALIPTRIASTTNELTEKKRETELIRENLEKATTINSEKNAQLELLTAKLKKSQKKLTEVTNSELFQHNNPYPKGLGKLRVGDSGNAVFDIYEKEKINAKNPSYYSINLDGLISNISYYFDEDDKEKNITHILILMSYLGKDEEDVLLQPLLEEALGQPFKHSRDGYFTWNTQYATVFKDDERSYLIMTPGYLPGSWPTKMQDEATEIIWK